MAPFHEITSLPAIIEVNYFLYAIMSYAYGHYMHIDMIIHVDF